ncbi:MAG: hypothetical protein N2039_05030 [Gemmataceae bacterium]|nr:hypothetical protein [Gemmataceae bacterium]
MDENIFVSDFLRATREGQTDPQGVVADWIDELESVLENEELTSDEAFTLLATREKLRRVKPEFINDENGWQVLKAAEQRIAAGPHSLLESALALVNPQAWLEDLRRLHASFEDEDEIDPYEQSIFAAQLIDDLDDAQLLLVAAQRFGIQDNQLEEQLDLCESDLVAHADLFYEATIHVQSIGLTLRTDLDETDYNLAATTLKFIDLLEAAEVVEAENNFDHITPLDPDLARALYHALREEAGYTQPRRTFLKLMNKYRRAFELLPVAAATPHGPTEPPQRFVWRSPDGSAFARMILPGTPTSTDEEIRIGFFKASDQTPFTALAGKRIRVGDAEATVRPEGWSAFSLKDLVSSKEPWKLMVESDETEWQLELPDPEHDR